MYAAIDLGSNSFRLHIGAHRNNAIEVLHRLRVPIAFAAGLDRNGRLSEPCATQAVSILSQFRTVLANHGPLQIRAVGTASLRGIRHESGVLAAFELALGRPIDVLPVEEEGRLIYMGVANTLATPGERRLVIDIGGGATELIQGYGATIERAEAFTIGTVKQGLTFFSSGRLDTASMDAAIASARTHLRDVAPMPPAARAYGASGTIRALARMIQAQRIGDASLSLVNLEELARRACALGHVGLLDLAGADRSRALGVAGGLAILIALLRELALPALSPTEAGLRMGVMWDLHLRAVGHSSAALLLSSLAHRFYVDAARHPSLSYWLETEQAWWDEA